GQLQAQQDSITREMAELRKQSSAGKGKQAVDAKLHELQGELDMVNARKNLLDTMTEFVSSSDPKAAGAHALKSQIDAIAATVPVANTAAGSGAAPEPPPPGQGLSTAPQSANDGGKPAPTRSG